MAAYLFETLYISHGWIEIDGPVCNYGKNENFTDGSGWVAPPREGGNQAALNTIEIPRPALIPPVFSVMTPPPTVAPYLAEVPVPGNVLLQVVQSAVVPQLPLRPFPVQVCAEPAANA
ncbi:MAG: hypothetical protein ABI389_09215 [Rhodanobacter sp.]